MPETVDTHHVQTRPRWLLTQNRELKAIGVFNWTLPAWAGRLPDGRTYNTCPAAGICRHVCYARNSTYLWPAVRGRHHANLAYVLDDLAGWESAMTAELGARRYRNAWIRVHDSGDFFSDAYLGAWLRISRARPHNTFYAYTKRFRGSAARRTGPAAELPVGLLLRRYRGSPARSGGRPGRRRVHRRGRHRRSRLVVTGSLRPARGARPAAGRHPGQPHPQVLAHPRRAPVQPMASRRDPPPEPACRPPAPAGRADGDAPSHRHGGSGVRALIVTVPSAGQPLNRAVSIVDTPA